MTLLRSLRFRLIATVVLIECAMAFLLLWDNLSTAKYVHAHRLQMTATDLIRHLTNISASHIVKVDYAGLEEYLRSEVTRHQLDYVVIHNHNHRTIIRLGESPTDIHAREDVSPLQVDDGVYDIKGEIKLAGRSMGHLWLGFSTLPMHQAIRSTRGRNITIAAAGIILTVVATIIIVIGMTRRLGLLASAAAQVGSGNYNISVPAGVDDEIGQTASAFNRMVAEIANRTHHLAKLSSALKQTADSVMITNREGVIEYVNPAFEATTGYCKDEAVGKTPGILKSGKQDTDFYHKLWSTISNGTVFSEIFINRKKNGDLFYEEKTISPLKNTQGEVTHFIATGRDISERIQNQERLQFLAHHDALTELPNRMLFLDRLKQSLASAHRSHDRYIAILFIDLDQFKIVNDNQGHEVGDRLLQQLGKRLISDLREGDTVARLGGDEFAVLLNDLTSPSDVSPIAKKILDTLAPPFGIIGYDFFITASIGISLYPNDGEDSTTLLRKADVAMYKAKDLGKNNFQFYAADMGAGTFERVTLEKSMSRTSKTVIIPLSQKSKT